MNFPDKLVLNKSLSKAFFTKNFDLSAKEKKILKNIIKDMSWFVNLKPSNANISKFINDDYIFEEIQFFICRIGIEKFTVNTKKSIELLQKYIPYQSIIIVENDNGFVINTCDKRINKTDSNKRTIANYNTTPSLSKLYKDKITESFFKAIDFNHIDKTNLRTTYNSYAAAVVQLQVSKITHQFSKRPSRRSEEDMKNLMLIEDIEKEIITLANQIKKESQLNTKVELNMKIQTKRGEIDKLKQKLSAL